jgi:hypothetical protein
MGWLSRLFSCAKSSPDLDSGTDTGHDVARDQTPLYTKAARGIGSGRRHTYCLCDHDNLTESHLSFGNPGNPR